MAPAFVFQRERVPFLVRTTKASASVSRLSHKETVENVAVFCRMMYNYSRIKF